MRLWNNSPVHCTTRNYRATGPNSSQQGTPSTAALNGQDGVRREDSLIGRLAKLVGVHGQNRTLIGWLDPKYNNKEELFQRRFAMSKIHAFTGKNGYTFYSVKVGVVPTKQTDSMSERAPEHFYI